jgi:predicted AlkP superfamily phosphohydrolase/phosphomutase
VTRELVSPPDYFDTLKQIAPDYFIIPDYNARAADPMADFADRLRREVELRERVALHIMRTETWDMLQVVIMATDEVQHTFWQCQAADDSSPLAKYRHVIRDIYQRCDEAVGRLIDAAQQDGRATDVIIVSDHGAGRFEWMVNLNQWLAEQGLLHFRANTARPIKQLRSTVMERAGQAYRRYMPARARMAIRNTLGAQRFSQMQQEFQSALLTTTIDWANTQAYSLGAGGNLYVNVKGREPTGMIEPGAEYEAIRQRLIDALLAMRAPDNDAPMVRQAYRREELYHGAMLDHAPDVIVQWTDYAYWGRGYYGSQVSAFEQQRHFDFSDQPLTGSHRPEGILIAYGPHIRSGARVQGAKLVDLAPTIFHLLGFAPPAEMDGRVLSEMLIDVGAAPIQMAATTSAAPEQFDYTPEEAAQISEHLRALGYL